MKKVNNLKLYNYFNYPLIGAFAFFVFFFSGGAIQAKSLDYMIAGDVVFFNESPNNALQRYSLSAQEWLEPLVFEEEIDVYQADSEDLFVAFDRVVYAYDHDGENKRHVTNMSNPVTNIYTFSDSVFVLEEDSHYLYERPFRLSRPEFDSLGGQDRIRKTTALSNSIEHGIVVGPSLSA